MDALARLAGIADALALGAEVNPADARWLAEAVVALAADGSVKLDAVLNLPPTWRRDLRHQQRDDRLRRLAASMPGTTAAKAAALQAALRNYQAAGWLCDRRLSTLPPSTSERRRLLHEVMRLDEAPPTSLRHLSAILDDCENGGLLSADGPLDTGCTER